MRRAFVVAGIVIATLLVVAPLCVLRVTQGNLAAGIAPRSGIETEAPAPDTYLLTFTEQGLPSGTNWSVSLDETTRSSSSSTITFSEPNGTYQLYTWDVKGYANYNNLTTLHVNGTPIDVTVSYFPPPDAGFYYVTFGETGLPFNDFWKVEICAVVNGTESCGMGQSYLGPTHNPTGFYGVKNGTYDWIATLSNITEFPIALDYPFPSSGQVAVNGSCLFVHLTFRFSYPFFFEVTGLSGSAALDLQIPNETVTGSGNGEYLLMIPNGTYEWNATAPGYRSQNGTISVQGKPMSNVVGINFVALPSTGVGSLWEWIGVGMVIAVVAAVAIFVGFRRRKAGKRRTLLPSRRSGQVGPPQ